MIKNLNDYQEVLLVGSGKGITSVDSIEELKWKSKIDIKTLVKDMINSEIRNISNDQN